MSNRGVFPGLDQVQNMVGSVFEQAKQMKQGMSWNGNEFTTFAEAVKFLQSEQFSDMQIISHDNKICVFYTR